MVKAVKTSILPTLGQEAEENKRARSKERQYKINCITGITDSTE